MPGLAIDILKELSRNALMGVPAIRRWRVRRGWTCLAGEVDIKERAQEFLRQFRFFRDALEPTALNGAVVAEIGPGDALPLGLLLLGAGAKRYIAVDRFVGDVAGPLARQLYASIADIAPEPIREGWQGRSLDPKTYPWLGGAAEPAVELLPVPIERVSPEHTSVADIIISWHVVEHLQDVAASFANMARLLRDTGRMVHEVDYGPHNCWSAYPNPLTFLTFCPLLWWCMGSNRGTPNRLRHSQIIGALTAAGFESEVRRNADIALEDVESIRHALPKQSRNLPADDLRVRTATITSRKPPRACTEGAPTHAPRTESA